MSKSKIVACVVTYNRKEKLLNCIRCLKDQSYNAFDILIIDNASTDGTKEAIRSYIDDHTVIYKNTGANLGGAGGFNYAIKNSANDYDYIWIMDDDTYPKRGALQAFVDAIPEVNNEFGYLSSIAEWTDGKACLMNKQAVASDIYENLRSLEKGIIPIETASFVSLFIKSDMVKKEGLPIKEFFLWGDDTEYTTRLRKYGGYLILNSVVIHAMNANDGVDIIYNDISRVGRYALFVRNRIYIAHLHGTRADQIRAYISPLKQTFRVLTKAKDHKRDRIEILMDGLRQGLKFHPEIERL